MQSPQDSEALGKRKRDTSGEDGDATVKTETVALERITFDDGGESDLDDMEDTEYSEGDCDEDSVKGECQYNESSESYPQCMAYDEEFTRIGQSLIGIPTEVMTIINDSGCKSTRAQSCRDNARHLARIPRSKRAKIALLGNTGVGKSSLLNSLLDMPKMAKAMAAGQSCTHVATEYESPFLGQKTKFEARIEYFDTDQIEKLLGKLLQDYNVWTFERPDDMEPNEEQELKNLAATALDAFASLFCNHIEMSSPAAVEDYLSTMYVDNDADTLATLCGWCARTLKEKLDGEDDYIECVVEDRKEEFLEQLNPLVFSMSSLAEPALWPLVKRVRVGIEGTRILDHVILVDLPGVDDTNKVRANACLDILNTCTSIWIVTKIGRAITDTAVDNLLWRYGKVYNVAVVCTGTDENITDSGLANHLSSQGQSVGEHDPLLARERELRKSSKKYMRMIEQRRAKLEGRNPVRDERNRRPLTEAAKTKLLAQLAQFQDCLKNVEEQLPKVSLERFELLVDARNAFTTRRIVEEKAEYLPADEVLKVFCVSNAHYDALKGGRIVNGPFLSAERTGVPAARHFILEAASHFPKNTMDNYINYKFTVFMQGLAMWAGKYTVEKSKELLDEVEKPQKRIDTVMKSFHKGVVESSEIFITRPLAGASGMLVEKAKAAVDNKRKWHWLTMRAFVRNEGNYATSVAKQQSWNEGFMAGATEIVNQHWEDFLRKHTELHIETQVILVGLVKGMVTFLEGHPTHVNLPMERLREMFAAQQEGIIQACAEHRELLENDLRTMYLDLTQDRHSGYFTLAMLEVYEKCKSDKGAGVKARTLTNIATHLSQEGKQSPFTIATKKFTSAISKETKARNKTLSRETAEILKEIHSQLSEMVEQKSDDTAEERLRVKFREFLTHATPRFGEIKKDLERLKGRYGIKMAD